MRFPNTQSPDFIALLRQNDARAWHITYESSFRQLYAIGMDYTSSKELATDLAHDALLLCYEYLQEASISSLAEFIRICRRTMVNNTINYFKIAKKRRKREEEFWGLLSPFDFQPEPPDVFLRKAFECLDIKVRHVVRLHYRSGMSLEQISNVMGMSASTVKRIRRQFQEFAQKVA